MARATPIGRPWREVLPPFTHATRGRLARTLGFAVPNRGAWGGTGARRGYQASPPFPRLRKCTGHTLEASSPSGAPRPSGAVGRIDQTVAHTTHGLEKVAGLTQLLAQPLHVRVDGPGLEVARHFPRIGEELLP